MTFRMKFCLPLGSLLLAACVASLPAQDPAWDTQMEAGAAAFDAGRYVEAEQHLNAALKEAEQFGRDDPRLAASLLLLGRVYRAQGNYAEAEPLLHRALAIQEKALGPEHPDVATSLHHLALLYRDQGAYAGAEPLYKRALAITERALGPDHPKLATTLESYAGLLRKMGREDEAKKMEARAQAIRTRHGQQNPSQ